jgi:DNA-binding response OmpR family regulator
MSKCPCCGGDLSGADRPYISLETNTLMAGGEVINLPPTEAELVYVLVNAMPMPADVERIIAKLWGANPIDDPINTLHVYIYKLRKKLKIAGLSIRNVWGVGYALEYTKAA